jgi:pimeloyl-ACP methyl ester carboxylesterase
MTSTTSRTLASHPDLTVALDESGSGRPVLILHGGGGPATVTGIAEHVAETGRALLPTHPGWNGTARPDWLTDVATLADLYLELLKDEGLSDVALIGSSVGGWLAAEMAARDTAGLTGALVVVDGVGITVPDEPIRDFFALDARGVAEYSYYDAERFYIDPATLTEDQIAARIANMATLRVYAGDPYMHDPSLAARLAAITVPALVLWGEADRIATPGYGRAFAAAIPGARFEIVERAGHLPQLEQPETTFGAIDEFLAGL